MKKIYFLWSLLGLLTLHMGWAQSNITGTVNDETGAPLPGATVIIEGTSIGVATDFDGNFIIEASQGEILLITYVGYSDQRITVGSEDSYTINMNLDNELEEVVVCFKTPEAGNWTLEMEDVFGDGWNGASISVSIDGVVTEYTCTGNSTIETINIPPGTSRLLFTYTAGDWEGENLYTLSDPSGTLILSDGTGDGSRTNGPAEGEQYNTCD